MLSMDDVQIAVLAHGAQQATFERSMWSWRRLNGSPLVICPEDDPVTVPPGVPLRRAGRQGHSGAVASKRLKAILHVLRERQAAFTMLFEYDSLCLSPTLPEALLSDPRGFWSAKFNSGDPSFKSPWYLFPPWGMCRDTLNAISDTLDAHPDPIERGFHDRMMGFAAWKSQVPVVNTIRQPNKFAFGANKVDSNYIFMEMMDAIGNGATLIHHGLKL